MRRVFIHSNKKCEKNCLYCFSKWDNYVFPQICHNNFDDDVIAFYPTCDSDFEIDWKLCEQILKEYNDTKTIIFSFLSMLTAKKKEKKKKKSVLFERVVYLSFISEIFNKKYYKKQYIFFEEEKEKESNKKNEC